MRRLANCVKIRCRVLRSVRIFSADLLLTPCSTPPSKLVFAACVSTGGLAIAVAAVLCFYINTKPSRLRDDCYKPTLTNPGAADCFQSL